MFLSRRRPFPGRVFILALATLAATASLTSVGAQAPNPRELCRDGGFARFRDPSTGQPFRNQGQCIRTGAQGGALDPLPDLVVTKHCTRTSPTFVSCTVTVRNTGLGPAALPAGTPLLRDVLSLTTGAINLIEMQSPAGYDSAISDPCLGASQCTITLTAVMDQTFLPGDTLAVMHEVRASEAGATVTNTATVDPANAVGEANDGNNAVTIITPP